MSSLQSAIKAELFEAILNRSQVAAVVTDPQQPDHPIVYANKRFEELTGYSNEEIIGQNCRFLQGDKTDKQAIDKMRTGIQNLEKTTVVLQNYRKSGVAFWNRVTIEPMVVAGKVYFLGMQTDIVQEFSPHFPLEPASP